MALHVLSPLGGTPRVVVRANELLATTKPQSREEELRLERQRSRLRGLTDVVWASHASLALLPVGGDLFAWSAERGAVRLTQSDAPELDPKLCADGKTALFVRGSEVVALEVAARTETVLTSGEPGTTRGQSDFNAQEEFDEPSGYFPSPDCSKVAVLEVDERGVAEEPIAGLRQGRSDWMLQRYPRPGEANPKVRLLMVDRATKRATRVSLPFGDERYLARFRFSADGAALFFFAMPRDQRSVSLVRVDTATGTARELGVEQAAQGWMPMPQLMAPAGAPVLVTTSILDGHTHLVTRSPSDGSVVRRLTEGPWDVLQLVGYDAPRERVLFTATKESPLEQHLYAVATRGATPPSKLTSEPGVHEVVLGTTGRFVDLHSARDRAPKARVVSVEGVGLGDVPMSDDPELGSLGLRPFEALQAKASDGTVLHGLFLPPRAIVPGARHPLLVMVYGGPGVQAVRNAWSPRLLWQHLADRGFAVMQFDNRGSAHRGHAFETALAGRLGEVELADQLAALAFVQQRPYVDPTRVGIYGHSYGGFLALRALLAAPDQFQVGIAGAPVTDWRLYDSGYTERFLGSPGANAAGYDASEVTRLAAELRGKLLLIHGLLDENVHFAHTAKLAEALARENRPFDLLVFPGERHGTRDPAMRRHLTSRVLGHLVTHLGAPALGLSTRARVP
jgi:dipeptidyl-peptidase-4